MRNRQCTRRQALVGSLFAGVLGSMPSVVTFAANLDSTGIVDTRSGRIRGRREAGVSVFRGIPYGADTAEHRFQPAPVAKSWTGVRDCFVFGPEAPQLPFAQTGPVVSEVGRVIAAMFSAGSEAAQSEDCLVLDVYTPDASPARKRPVMVWLHGGGFTVGAGGAASYDGSALCRRGDVVVVTINHRLNAMGYLFLGEFHPDFADSGNVGQLDIVLALQWVRDNIAHFGGDANSVTIFGESGGGAKVGTLLAQPPAKGLFHKGIIQSGPTVKMVEKADAVEVAERALNSLGIGKADVHQLQTMDLLPIMKAVDAIHLPAGRRGMGPVVDGRSLPAHPFFPKATEVSRDVPVIIGTNKDEATLFLGMDPKFGKMTAEEARKRFDGQLGDKSAEAFEFYRSARPNDPPTYWVTSMTTDMGTWMNSIRVAERKADQAAARTFMYRLDWESAAAGGALRSPHGLDVGLVFDHVGTAQTSELLGTGDVAKALAAAMSQSWINFAKTGDPSTKGLRWPHYEPRTRQTMIFDTKSHVVDDPDRAKREFWEHNT